MASSAKRAPRKKKRAIALAGGGPAAGFHIGALSALEEHGITFDIWSLSCIGAWVGVYYNLMTGPNKAKQTFDFFKEHAFRDTASYQGFPVNKAFTPNLQAYATAWMTHALDPKTYRDVFNVGTDLPSAAAGWSKFLATPAMWGSEGDRNAHVLNNILAVHPMSRFLTSMLYSSGINGLSNIYYKDSTFLANIKLAELDLLNVEGLGQFSSAQLSDLIRSYDPGLIPAERRQLPEIYHNAWRLTDDSKLPPVTGALQLFNNKWYDYRRRDKLPRTYLPITHPSLCSCSALPYIEQTVQVPNDDFREYSEGALFDTVSFRNLVEDHPDLDEIWVCRIVDYRQVRLQKNLHDSLGNLCEQFAAEVGENDIELFKSHLRKSTGRIPRIVEIPLQPKTRINYRWDHENLQLSFDEGQRAVRTLLEQSTPPSRSRSQSQSLSSETTLAPEWPT